jgi:hypothetical protein
MANDQFEDEEPIDEELDGQPEDEEPPKPAGGWQGWLISGSLHALILVSMLFVVYAAHKIETEPPPVRIATIEPPQKKEEKPKENRTLETTVELDVTAESDKPSPITNVEMPVDNTEKEEDNDNPTPKGREEAVADSETGGSGAFMAIGGGGGSSGMFGARSGGGRKRAVSRFGGSKASESAVDAALRWFKKHQSPNGSWDAAKYYVNCTDDGPKCEPGGNQAGNTSVAMTGYAVLCFLGAGFDHQTPNKYRQTVKKGVDFLLSSQDANGLFGERNYENAIATMALAEAYAMTGDPALKGPAQRGVDTILKNQNQAGANANDKDKGYGTGLGWDYVAPTDRNDSSVTGWNVMALKSALAAQLNIGNGMEGAKHWLEKTWLATNGGKQATDKLDPYTGESRFPYTYYTSTEKVEIAAPPAPNAPDSEEKDLECVGSVCSVFLGHHAGDKMLETLSNYVMNHEMPTAYPTNTYKMYYNTLAIFQVGGDKWKKWNDSVRDILVNAQHKNDGCFDGSWDWNGTKFPGNAAGRVLSTAYCCLCLEVYYRYAVVAGNAAGAAPHK